MRTESGLFFFPRCLRDSANREMTGLERIHDSVQAIRFLAPSARAAVQAQLQAISEGLDSARSAVSSSGC